MGSVQINPDLEVSFQAILDGLSKSDLQDLELFMAQVSSLIANRKNPSLSKKETELLLKINQSLPEKIVSRYAELLAKSADGTMSEEEHDEALELTPVFEKKNVERLQYLVELASLWETSVDEVMEKLGITPPPAVHA